MDALDRVDAAAGEVQQASRHLKRMRGMPEERAAQMVFDRAVRHFEDAVRAVEDERDA